MGLVDLLKKIADKASGHSNPVGASRTLPIAYTTTTTTTTSVNPGSLASIPAHNMYPIVQTKVKRKFKSQVEDLYIKFIKGHTGKKFNVNIRINGQNTLNVVNGKNILIYYINLDSSEIYSNQEIMIAQNNNSGSFYINVSGCTIASSIGGTQTKYPHQTIKTLIKYLKEEDQGHDLIERIIIHKATTVIKKSIKEIQLGRIPLVLQEVT